MYASSSATSAASQSTAPASTPPAARDERQQPAINTAVSSIAEPTVRGNPQVVAASTPQNLQPNIPENPELVAYQIQMLNFYKAAVVDPLCAFAEQRQQIPELLCRQLETMVKEFDKVRQSLNTKLGRTTAESGAVNALHINRSMSMIEQLKAVERVSDHLSTLDSQLVNAQKVGRLTKNPVQKAKAYLKDLEVVRDKITRNLESQLDLVQADEAPHQALQGIRNKALVAHIHSLPLMDCLTSDTPVDPAAFSEFKKDFVDLVRKTIGDAQSSTTLKGLANYINLGLAPLVGDELAAQIQPLNASLAQVRRMHDITFKLVELVYKTLSAEQMAPILNDLQDELILNTHRSPQLQELLTKHPNRLVNVMAAQGVEQSASQSEVTSGVASPINSELAKRYPKITVSPKLLQTEIHRESAFKAAELGSLDTLHMLLAEGVNPLVRNEQGDSLLHIALRKGHIELATFLIQVQGVPADLNGAGGLSVLEQAIQNDEPLVIAGLLDAAGQGQVLGEKSTPAILTKANAQGQTPLQQVVQHNAVRVLEDWTNNFGFKLNNLQVQNQPVLSYVAKNGGQEMLVSVVPLLLTDTPSSANKEKVFALARECVEMGKAEAGSYLVKAFGVDVDKPDQHGRTSLHKAVIENNLQEMRMLKALGANLQVKVYQNNSAFHLAAMSANSETIKVLCNEFGFTNLQSAGAGGKSAITQLAGSAENSILQTSLDLASSQFIKTNHLREVTLPTFSNLLKFIVETDQILLLDAVVQSLGQDAASQKLMRPTLFDSLNNVAKNGSQEMLAKVVQLLTSSPTDTSTQEKVFALARECVEIGKPKIGKYLVNAFGLDVNRDDEDGRSLFHKAVIANNLQEMRMLKALGANVNTRDNKSCNALHLAAMFANPDTLRVLHGEFGFTYLESGLLHCYPTIGHNSWFDSPQARLTPFLLAAKAGNIPNLHALKSMGAKVDATDGYGNNAFYVAARFANPETLRVLRGEFGFTNVHLTGKFSRQTAFIGAVEGGNLENLRALKGMGENIYAVDVLGDNVFMHAAKISNPETLRFLRDVVGFKKVNVKNKKYGNTAFLSAASGRGTLANMRALKDMGANVKAINHDNQNALHLAAESGDPEVLLFLNRECGFKDLELKGWIGGTPFLRAASGGNLANLRCLQSMGANVHAKDRDGRTALDYAKGVKAKPEVIEYLQSLGITSQT